MAATVRAHTRLDVPGVDPQRVILIKWTGLDADDSGEPVIVPAGADATVQVYGTFGVGGSLSIEGANEYTSPTWAILNDSRGEGNPATFTAADIRQLMESPLQLRPIATAGDINTSLTVVIKFIRTGS